MSAVLPRVLLVEDNEDDAFFIRRAFQSLGLTLEIQHVRNGEEAITYLHKRKRELKEEKDSPPLLMLLDLKMPGTHGFSVLEWIQEQGELNLMVIILTASNQDSDIERADAFNVEAYLIKPASLHDTKEVARCILHLWMNRVPESQQMKLFQDVAAGND